jgi:hypothetical protein
MHPRESWQIRAAMAAQVATHVLTALPVGYWQRRVGARAFALDLVPVMPRESQHVRTWRLPGTPSIRMLATDVMTWGVIPWIWSGDSRLQVAEARRAVRRVLNTATAECCAAIFVAPPAPPDPRAHLARLRLTGAGSRHAAVGIVTWGELAEIFSEAARELGDRRARAVAAYGAQQLTLFTHASHELQPR